MTTFFFPFLESFRDQQNAYNCYSNHDHAVSKEKATKKKLIE